MPLSQAEFGQLKAVMFDNGFIEQPGSAVLREFVPGAGDVLVQKALLQCAESFARLAARIEIMLDVAGAASPVPLGGALADTTDAPAAGRKPRGRPAAPKDGAPKAEAKADKPADDNPFDTGPKANGAGDASGFAPADDPLEDKAPAELAEPEMKALLKEYMGRFGENGVAKLTNLLSGYGVKRFAELPAEKYAAVAAQARKEMAA